MKENVKIYTLSSLVFLCILSLGGGFSQPWALVFRLISFLIPSAIAIKLSEYKTNQVCGYLSLNKDCLLLLPVLLPSLLVIFGLSFLVSVIIYSLTGAQAPIPASGNIAFDVFSLALVPSFLEELLFRYIPLKTISPYSKKSAVIISSLFFAMIHTSLFSIPYAFVAGIIFITLDLMTKSIWPSVIIHFLNNLVSVVWMYNSSRQSFVVIFITALCSGALISLITMIIMRKKYRCLLNRIFEKEDKITLPIISLALIIPTLLIALIELI